MIARHQIDQTLMDDRDHLLFRSHRLQHLSADGFFRDSLHEILNNIIRDVGFQQGRANLLHPITDVRLGDLSGSPKSRKGAGQTFGNAFEHRTSQKEIQTE